MATKPEPATVRATAGDIVQIANSDHHWFAALIIVTEAKAFGCMGYAPMPCNDGTGTAQAYIRLQSDDYEIVGRAAFMPASEVSA